MDYFIVFLLVIIIFTFASDKKVISIKTLEGKIENLNEEIETIYNETAVINLKNIKINEKKEVIEYIHNNLKKDEKKKHVMLLLQEIEFSDSDIKTLIANYINSGKKACGFMPNYQYKYIGHKKIRNIISELKIVAINYINIFSKSNVNMFGVIILNKNEVSGVNYVANMGNNKEIITYSPCESVKVMCDNANDNLQKDAYESYNWDIDIKVIFKSGMLILAGIIVTANIVSAIYSMNFLNVIVSIIIYWCYSFVLKYMYTPIGKYKLLARYLFGVVLIIYLIIFTLNIFKKLRSKNKTKTK